MSNEKYDQMKKIMDQMSDDFQGFYRTQKPNMTAGTRIRNGMQSLKKLAQEIRIEVQAIKNAKK